MPKKYVEDVKEDAVSVRKACIEVWKNVQNSLYATENVDVLCQAREHLNELDIILNKEMPKVCEMPVRAKKKKSIGRSCQPVKLIKPEKASEKGQRVIPIDSELI